MPVIPLHWSFYGHPGAVKNANYFLVAGFGPNGAAFVLTQLDHRAGIFIYAFSARKAFHGFTMSVTSM